MDKKHKKLIKEFEHKYGMTPNENQLRQFSSWKETHSGNVWKNILKELNAAQKTKKSKAKKPRVL